VDSRNAPGRLGGQSSGADPALRELVEDCFPLPLSVTYRKLRHLRDELPSKQLRQLTDVVEVLIKYLAAISCRHYMREGGYDDQINERLRTFSTPSLGNWVELLRETLKATRDPSSADELITSLYDFYFKKLPGGQNHDVFEHATALRELVVDKPKGFKLTPTNGQLLDLFVRVRNKKLGHGATVTEAEYGELIENMMPMLGHMLTSLQVLKDFPLYFIKEVKVEDQVYIHSLMLCMGRDYELDKLELDSAPLNSKEVYICSLQTDEQDETELNQALSLSPYLILESCPSCKRPQLFFYNSHKGRRISYLSYQCGHEFVPSELASEFENIKDFLAGKVSLGQLFKGKSFGKELKEQRAAASLKDRKRAVSLVVKASECLASELPQEAESYARQALELDPDSVEANFSLASVHLLDSDLVASRDRFAEAVRLNPEHGPSLLGLGIISLELGDSDGAVQHLKHLLKVDPTNQLAGALVENAGAYRPSVSPERSPAANHQACVELLDQITAELRTDQIRIRSYLEALPPWSWIARLPFRPVVSSAAFALLCFAFVLGCNWGRWDLIFLLRFVVMSVLIFIGAWFPFVYSRLFTAYFHKLRRSVLLPTDTFKRWYLAQIARFWGSANLALGATRQQELHIDGAALRELRRRKVPSQLVTALEAQGERSFQSEQDLRKELKVDQELWSEHREALLQGLTGDRPWRRLVLTLRRDMFIIVPFWAMALLCAGINISCGYAIYPLQLTVPILAIYVIAVLEMYMILWQFTMAFTSFRLIPEIVKQPVRYHLGLPASLSLAPLAGLFLWMAFLTTFDSVLLFAQHYVWRTHENLLLGNIAGNVVIGVLLGGLLLVPLVALTWAMITLKQRMLADYSGSMEQAFSAVVENPTKKGFDVLVERDEIMRYLKRRLPVSGFTLLNWVAFLAIVVVNGVAAAIYGWAVLGDYWPF